MLIEDLSKIGFSFCFGFLLSPFTWGLLYLPIFIIIFGIIDYAFFKGSFTYEYFEHRTSIIYYGIIGFIIGRTFHDLSITPIEGLYIKKRKKELHYNLHKLLYKDLKLISKIRVNSYINITDKNIVNTKEGIGKDHYTIMFFSELCSFLFLVIFPGVLTGITSDHIVKVIEKFSLLLCLFCSLIFYY